MLLFVLFSTVLLFLKLAIDSAGFAAAYKLRGDYARLNFPHRRHVDQGGSSGGASADPGTWSSNGSGDSGVTSTSPKGSLISSTLETKLQEIAYQKNLQAKMEGDKSHPHSEPSQYKAGLRNSKQQTSTSEQTTLKRSESPCSTNVGVSNHLPFRQGGDSSSPSLCHSPPSSSSSDESRCVSSPGSGSSDDNGENNKGSSIHDLRFDIDSLLYVPNHSFVDMSWDVLCLNETPESTSSAASVGVVRKQQAHSVSSATLSPAQQYNVWRQCG